jgi:hypothetical protein
MAFQALEKIMPGSFTGIGSHSLIVASPGQIAVKNRCGLSKAEQGEAHSPI